MKDTQLHHGTPSMVPDRPPVVDPAASMKDLHLSASVAPPPLPPSYALPGRKFKPRRLVSLCLGVLGQHFEDIVADLEEIAACFPPHVRAAMLAIVRRRKLLNDEILLALAKDSWNLLDVSGSDVTDLGLEQVAKHCSSLKAVDISRCKCITPKGVSELISHCHSLEILRFGGCPRSDLTARRSMSILKPELKDIEEESWEDLDGTTDLCNGARSLRWLVWPNIDEDSKLGLETECPRIILNPKSSRIRGIEVPTEALASVPLDRFVVEDVDPRTWAAAGAAARPSIPRLKPPPPSPAPMADDAPEMSVAEKFRLAFVERDARLAPKRAKNVRQHQRRAERELLMSSDSAKSIVLASKAGKFLQSRS